LGGACPCKFPRHGPIQPCLHTSHPCTPDLPPPPPTHRYLVYSYGVYVRSKTCTRATFALAIIASVVLLWKLWAAWTLWGLASALLSAAPCGTLLWVLYRLNIKGAKYYPRSVCRGDHEAVMIGAWRGWCVAWAVGGEGGGASWGVWGA
jgi:hypothetical protein